MDCIFTSNSFYLSSLYNRYLLTKGTLYHKGLSYLIQSIIKSEYILCSTLCLGDVLYFRISIKGLILKGARPLNMRGRLPLIVSHSTLYNVKKKFFLPSYCFLQVRTPALPWGASSPMLIFKLIKHKRLQEK